MYKRFSRSSQWSSPEPSLSPMLGLFLLLAIGAGLLTSAPIQALPQITGVSPQVIAAGDVIELTGSGFIADPSRYSVVLVDGQGLVATGEVLAVTPNLLQAVIHGGRASNLAWVVVREGVTVPLADMAVSPEAQTRDGSWFQGSGDRTIVGPVVALLWEPDPPGSGGHAGGHGLPGGRIFIGWPFGCSEITAKVTMGGDDPFDPGWRHRELPTKVVPKAQALMAEPLREHWQAGLTVYLTGEAAANAGAGVSAITDALNASFLPFGLDAAPFETEAGIGISVGGERMSPAAGVTLLGIKCVMP